MTYYIGQGFGVISTVLCVCAPFLNDKRKILLMLALANLSTAINLILINEIGSAMLLNSLAVFHTLLQLYHVVKKSDPKRIEIVIFFILYVAVGIFGMLKALGFTIALSLKTLLEVLPVIAGVMFMLGVITKGEQSTRKFLLCNCVLYVIYYGAIGSTAIFAVLFSAVTNVIAIVKHRSKKKVYTDG